MFLFETKNGKEFTFRMKDGEHFYRFYSECETPALLRGQFTDHLQGQHAWDRYSREVDDKKPMQVSKLPVDERVEKLSKKDDLLYLAEQEGIEIPESMKNPAAIKKYLRGVFSA